MAHDFTFTVKRFSIVYINPCIVNSFILYCLTLEESVVEIIIYPETIENMPESSVVPLLFTI
jgi:hypothetical protein